MPRADLRHLDLNLLVVLDVLLEERSVTRAATRLGRTQSAVSHALNRLRDALGDELLVRDGRLMRPTARAAALAESLPRALEGLDRSLQPPAPFRPAETRRTFRLAAPDFIGVLLAELLAAVSAEAPGARIEVVTPGRDAVEAVAEGRYDALLAPPGAAGEGLRAETLGHSPWRVFGRRGHPAFRRWSLRAWARFTHLQIHTTGRSESPVDRATEAAGVTRTTGAILPHFAMAPAVLAQTDLLLTVPAVALPDPATAGLVSQPAPLPLADLPLALHRSAVFGGEAGARWFCNHVERVAQRALGPEANDGR